MAGLSEPSAAMLLTEGQRLAQVSHPNCVRILDVQRTADAVWFVMEYVPGPTLQDLLDQAEPPPPATSLAMIRDLADVLAHLAHLGLVHHDIKPGNIIINPARGPVLVDFGSCVAASRPGESNGSVAFMAPERLEPGSSSAGPGADVYALGVLAFWLLVGSHPFAQALSSPAAMAHAHRTATPLSTGRGLPRTVRRAVRSATQPDPQRRISAAALGLILHRLTSKETSWSSAPTVAVG